MGANSYSDIKDSLRLLYLEDPRPWLVGSSGGKDSTMLTSLLVEVVARITDDQRKKPVTILCSDTRVEIAAIFEKIGGNPIEFLTTEEVWACLLQKANPWGGDNRPLHKHYASASNGECTIQTDTSTRSSGNSRLSWPRHRGGIRGGQAEWQGTTFKSCKGIAVASGEGWSLAF
jgi:3'-phosphoadenosine 5'-phosphosulfate sulfotransferase (PAPS reductase)/FAD synthetase